jgi:hypothetical protein
VTSSNQKKSKRKKSCLGYKPLLQGQYLNLGEAFSLFYLHMLWCPVEDTLTEELLFQTKPQQDPKLFCHLRLPEIEEVGLD